MIKKDQPTIFGSDVIAAVSSVHDGNMKSGFGLFDDIVGNRRCFLESVGIDMAHTTLVKLTYDTDDFAKYRIVTHQDKNVGMETSDTTRYADALAVSQPNHALFLPLADCVGAILYDPVSHILMVSHLGRHSVEVDGGRKSAEYLGHTFGVKPKNLRVWLSPAVGNATYPLEKFDGKSLHEVIMSQLLSAGVVPRNVEVSGVDTAIDSDYFSHSQYLKDTSQPNGRFAVVAMMRAQGEPAA